MLVYGFTLTRQIEMNAVILEVPIEYITLLVTNDSI
jgi:hypothetical protein